MRIKKSQREIFEHWLNSLSGDRYKVLTGTILLKLWLRHFKRIKATEQSKIKNLFIDRKTAIIREKLINKKRRELNLKRINIEKIFYRNTKQIKPYKYNPMAILLLAIMLCATIQNCTDQCEKLEGEAKEVQEDQKAIIEKIKEHFSRLPDPRKVPRKHKKIDIVIIALCGTVSGANGWETLTDYGESKKEFFKEILGLEGIPSADTFRKFFKYLKSEAWKECFLGWIRSIAGKEIEEVVAIDGKTMRGTKEGGKAKIHMVSAWASEQRLVLGQYKVAEKSNEITAIPKLLEELELSKCIVTIDAMGCQTKIAEKIKTKGAEYILGLKGNNKGLHNAVKTFFKKGEGEVEEYECSEKRHGRKERRVYRVINNVKGLQGQSNWKGLKSVMMVEYHKEEKGKVKKEVRYFISSLGGMKVKEVAKKIRDHWKIENSLHWVLDVAFKEDKNRIRKGNAPENLGILRHLALNLLGKEKTFKAGIERKRQKAGWDISYMLLILKQFNSLT